MRLLIIRLCVIIHACKIFSLLEGLPSQKNVLTTTMKLLPTNSIENVTKAVPFLMLLDVPTTTVPFMMTQTNKAHVEEPPKLTATKENEIGNKKVQQSKSTTSLEATVTMTNRFMVPTTNINATKTEPDPRKLLAPETTKVDPTKKPLTESIENVSKAVPWPITLGISDTTEQPNMKETTEANVAELKTPENKVLGTEISESQIIEAKTNAVPWHISLGIANATIPKIMQRTKKATLVNKKTMRQIKTNVTELKTKLMTPSKPKMFVSTKKPQIISKQKKTRDAPWPPPLVFSNVKKTKPMLRGNTKTNVSWPLPLIFSNTTKRNSKKAEHLKSVSWPKPLIFSNASQPILIMKRTNNFPTFKSVPPVKTTPKKLPYFKQGGKVTMFASENMATRTKAPKNEIDTCVELLNKTDPNPTETKFCLDVIQQQIDKLNATLIQVMEDKLRHMNDNLDILQIPYNLDYMTIGEKERLVDVLEEQVNMLGQKHGIHFGNTRNATSLNCHSDKLLKQHRVTSTTVIKVISVSDSHNP